MGDHADDMEVLDWVYEDMQEELEELADQGVWVMKDDTHIKITDMKNSHLLNTINYLDRKGDEYFIRLYRDQMIDEAIKRKLV
jgi:hypothetical protein